MSEFSFMATLNFSRLNHIATPRTMLRKLRSTMFISGGKVSEKGKFKILTKSFMLLKGHVWLLSQSRLTLRKAQCR